LKVIVFGGSGFVGSHLADTLSDEGHQVSIFDLVPSPYIRSSQEMVVGDLQDYEQVRDAVMGCSVVCNFAGAADLDDARTKAAETVRKNILGTVNILEACRESDVKRYMHASSIYVYSKRGGFYRCSKQAAELYVEEFQKHYGLDFTILRFGTLYGPRADSRNSVYRYLHQALTERRIQCVGSGEQIREYINVKDAVRLCVQSLNSEFRNQHLIITGIYPIRFRQMLEMIKEIIGGDIEIEFDHQNQDGHYEITPYTFEPQSGYKLTTNINLDMGQGLLECLREMHKQSGQGNLETVTVD